MKIPQALSLDELAKQIGRDAREVEKLAEKGKLPGRRVDGTWHFQVNEIREWIETGFANTSEGEWEALESSQQSDEVDQEHPVTSLLKLELIEIPLQARTKRSVLERLVEVANRTWQVWSPDEILQGVLEREDLHSTALEEGVAIPHTRSPMPDALGESVIAFGRTVNGIPFGGSRHLTDLFFLVLCRDTKTHLQILARLGRLFHAQGFLQSLREAESSDEAWEIISAAEAELK